MSRQITSQNVVLGGDGVNADGSQNIQEIARWASATMDRSAILVLSAARTAPAGADSGIVNIANLYTDKGTDLRQLILLVTANAAGQTIGINIDYYPATGSTAAKSVTGAATIATTGVAAFSIPVADQIWPRMKVTLTSTGNAAYTAEIDYAYTTRVAVEQ